MVRNALVGAATGGLLAVSGCRGRPTPGTESDLRAAARDLPAAAEAYRATGLPWIARDLAPDPSVRPEENAAPLLRRGAAEMVRRGWSGALGAIRRSADEGRWDDLAAALRGYEPALATLAQAAKRPRADFGRDWDLGVEVLFSEYAGIKGGVQALALRARLKASRGEAASALADLRTARALARLAEADSNLLALVVRVAGERAVYDGTRRIAAETPALSPALITELDRPAPPPDLPRALRGEAYLAVASARNLTKLNPDPLNGDFRSLADPRRILRTGFPKSETRRAYMARVLALWTAVAAERRRYPRDPYALGVAIDRLSAREAREPGRSHRLARVVVAPMTTVGAALAKLGAERTLTLAYLRALDARRRAGSLPTVLVTGNDPFGRPYRSRREGEAFRLWSLGPDGRDDGGATRKENPKTDDVTVVYPPPKR